MSFNGGIIHSGQIDVHVQKRHPEKPKQKQPDKLA